MKPLAVHHVSINVVDVDAGVTFYAGVLGATVRTDRPELGIAGAWLDLGGQQVHLIEGEVPSNCGQHFAVQVGDIDAAVEELRTKGVDVNDPVTIGSGRQTFIEDPAGNVVELHQVGDL